MQASLRTQLLAGEGVLWEGRPEKWPFIIVSPLHLLLFTPFALAWAGFFVFVETLAIKAGSTAGIVFTTPFAFIGLYLAVGRYWAGARCWSNTYYVVTNRRILIQSGTFSPKVTSLDFSNISSLKLQRKRHGLGHIHFNSKNHHVYASLFFWQPGPSWASINGIIRVIPSFRYIRSPEIVHEQLRSLLAHT